MKLIILSLLRGTWQDGLRPNSELVLAPPSTTTKKTLGDRAFTAVAPSLWNKQLREIQEEDNFECFNSKLNTFYLE